MGSINEEEVRTDLKPPPFWSISEDIVLGMIAFSAHSLANKHPFKEHPANKDVPKNPLYRGPPVTASNSPRNANMDEAIAKLLGLCLKKPSQKSSTLEGGETYILAQQKA